MTLLTVQVHWIFQVMESSLSRARESTSPNQGKTFHWKIPLIAFQAAWKFQLSSVLEFVGYSTIHFNDDSQMKKMLQDLITKLMESTRNWPLVRQDGQRLPYVTSFALFSDSDH